MMRISRLFVLAVLAIAGMRPLPVEASIVTISPTGTTGPGGTITFSEIGQLDLGGDPSSANVNTNFTAAGVIPITFTVSDDTPVSIYGNDVNGTTATWTAFTATIVSGTATFYDLNDPYNP